VADGRSVEELSTDPAQDYAIEHGYTIVEAFFREHFEPQAQESMDAPFPTIDLIRHLDRAVAGAVVHELHQIAYHMGGCSLFTTDTNYIGRAAHNVQEGDVAAVIFGCPRPAILRPFGDAYKLVTFAWIHGVMNGELSAPNSGMQSFTLI
jgi:hypothetical protein